MDWKLAIGLAVIWFVVAPLVGDRWLRMYSIGFLLAGLVATVLLVPHTLHLIRGDAVRGVWVRHLLLTIGLFAVSRAFAWLENRRLNRNTWSAWR